MRPLARAYVRDVLNRLDSEEYYNPDLRFAAASDATKVLANQLKPYGVIVRKMDFPSSAPLDEMRRLLSGQQGGRPVSMPILVYRLYQDGHEELVRGLRFRGLNARSLKDILAAGDDSAAFEYMENSAPFALMGGSEFTAETCVVAPSILIDDLELHPVEEELPKLPVVSPPEMVP